MSLMSALLTPLALLFPAVSAGDAAPASGAGAAAMVDRERSAIGSAQPVAGQSAPVWLPEQWYQVRIERRVVLRIAPRRVTLSTPENRTPVRYRRQSLGECMDMDDIGAVRPASQSRLLFYRRQGDMVSVQLDRSCRAQAFYSGFYVERSDDGRLCTMRERLRSRSGVTCQIASLDRLVPVAE